MSKSDLSNEKLSRLVDILKSVVVEQAKSHEEILTNQKKIMEALKDLRRKANVNISRSDDLLKKIKK